MSAQTKLKNKLTHMSSDELFEVMRGTALGEDQASYIVYDMACEIYMRKVPEETFLQAMDIMDKMLVSA